MLFTLQLYDHSLQLQAASVQLVGLQLLPKLGLTTDHSITR